ncbi:universal stress protein [Streptacidiphilus monticola]|uniref:Universal stress protein n=1 Tax=Streptacidiphilus monticola TaxID=2161674 RepID=A0ABW1G9A6_9ACTN
MSDLDDRRTATPAEDLQLHSGYGDLGPHGVLVGMDGSRTSVRAVDFALGYAARSRTRVIGLYVRPAAFGATGLVAGAAPFAEGAFDEIAAELRDYLASRAGELGLRHGFAEVRGDPLRELRRVARALRVDAIVVGASSRLDHRLWGSVGASLAKSARHPVIVVP